MMLMRNICGKQDKTELEGGSGVAIRHKNVHINKQELQRNACGNAGSKPGIYKRSR